LRNPLWKNSGWYGRRIKSLFTITRIGKPGRIVSVGWMLTLRLTDVLKDNKVETFNFAGLVGAFDTALAANPTMTSWSMTNALLNFHLGSGSDSAAIGGDLAYQYGKAGTLAGIGLNAAQSVISSAQFGQSAQTLNAPASWQAETVKLG
jgi:hypothetical protein